MLKMSLRNEFGLCSKSPQGGDGKDIAMLIVTQTAAVIISKRGLESGRKFKRGG
jgi:hypothetical protein